MKTRQGRDGTGERPIGTVYVVTPGGLRAKGGIGRMMDYYVRHWRVADAPLTVIDSYGPGRRGLMPLYFALACLRLTVAALLGRIGLLHIQMSERLSVWRKGLLVHIGKAFGIPVALHLHGADFADYARSLSPSGFARLQRMMAKADAVIVLGSYWRDFVAREIGIGRERIAVLHNAVPGPAALPDRPDGRPCKILFLGVVCERKGVPVLIEALADPALSSLGWTAIFAGNGEVEHHRAQARSLGLAGRTHFTGWVDEQGARALLAEADILVLPSRNEGLPMAILEAMAYGLAIVATPVGAIADAVTDGETGLLAPVGDSRALAGALGRLVADPALRRSLGAQARRRYEAMFDITAYNRRLERIFRRAVQGQPVAGEEADAPVPRMTMDGTR